MSVGKTLLIRGKVSFGLAIKLDLVSSEIIWFHSNQFNVNKVLPAGTRSLGRIYLFPNFTKLGDLNFCIFNSGKIIQMQWAFIFFIFNRCKIMIHVKIWNFKCVIKELGLYWTISSEKTERRKETYWPWLITSHRTNTVPIHL